MSSLRPVVLVTGASRGLGQQMAAAFASSGYAVAIHYSSNKQGAQTTENAVRSMDAPALLVEADVRRSDSVDAMMSKVASEWGRLDVLVNNAGNVRNRTIAKMSDDEWNDVIQTDLSGPFFCMRAAIPVMRKQGGGAIVNIASLVALKGSHGAGNYAAAKAGLIGLTKSVAQEEGKHNVRANAVIPGFHVTDINHDYWQKNEAAIRAQHMLAQMPDKEELAKFVVHIAGLKSVTGQVFPFESRVI